MLFEVRSLIDINNEHKDKLFKFIFGNTHHRDWALSLYNALNGSLYDSDYYVPDDIIFDSVDDGVLLGMKKGTSFIILSTLVLYEYHIIYNPNLPMKFFIYAAKLYDNFIANNSYCPQSSTLQYAPRPKCICFYSSETSMPEKHVLSLSSAVGLDSDIEVKVTLININLGKNAQLLNDCKPLAEYAWFIANIKSQMDVWQDI